jgi:Predicted metal-sulfur cluster biosynthetic enzyme
MPKTLDISSVLEILRPVQDPELQKSLVELNMIRNIKIDGGVVSFTLVLTTPACPLREFIVEDCQKAVPAYLPNLCRGLQIHFIRNSNLYQAV